MQLSEILTAIQARGYGTDTATAQTELVNSHYRRVNGMRRWPFLEVPANTTLSTTASDDSYPLSTITDLLAVDAVRISKPNEEIHPDLNYLVPQEFRDQQHADTVNGTPQVWTEINGVVFLWPKPDGVYTLSVDYTKFPADLADDADVPIWPSTFHDILVWGPIAELCFRERDAEGRAMAIEEYNKRLADMMHMYGVRQRQTASQVRKSGVWPEVGYGGTSLWPISP